MRTALWRGGDGWCCFADILFVRRTGVPECRKAVGRVPGSRWTYARLFSWQHLRIALPTGIAEATCRCVMQMERVLSPSSCPAGHGCTEEVFGGGLCASDAGMAPPDLNEQIRFFSRSDRFICAIMSGSCARCVLRVSNAVVENSTWVVGRRERL